MSHSVYQRLLQRCAASIVVASPPCSTFSASRHTRSDRSSDGGPPVVQTREHPLGLRDVSARHERELAEANKFVRRTVAILAAARDAGAEYIFDHPADGGCPRSPLFLDAAHSSPRCVYGVP
eukprot:3926276-Pleurochrysis_carterae.AAC.1